MNRAVLWKEGRRLAHGKSWEQIHGKQPKCTDVPADLGSAEMMRSFTFKINFKNKTPWEQDWPGSCTVTDLAKGWIPLGSQSETHRSW